MQRMSAGLIVVALVGAGAILCGAPAPASAAIILYEPFNYGSTDSTLVGKGGNTTGFSSAETWASTGTAGYVATGYTFGSGATQLTTLGGRATTSSQPTYAGRGIDLSQTTGANLWGSFLFSPGATSANAFGLLGFSSNANASTGAILSSSTSSAGGFSSYYLSGSNVFSGQGPAGVVLSQTAGTATAKLGAGGSAPSIGTTYMNLFKVTGLGTTAGSIQLWTLTSAQFDTFKTGGLTEAELNSATTGTGSTNVLNRTSALTLATTNGTAALTSSMFLNLGSSPLAAFSVDEVRLSDTSLDDVTPIVVPEPAALGLGSAVALSVLGLRRRRAG